MPQVVLILTLSIVGVTMVQFFGPPDLVNWMFEAGALIGGYEYAGLQRPYGEWAPLVLHIFLHGGILHLAMNMGALLSLGPAVAKPFGSSMSGSVVFLLFFGVCAVGGGLAQMWQFGGQDAGVAIGASSAISGLLPALGWLRGGFEGAVRMSIPWILINFALAATAGAIQLPIAWAAHLGGLAAGFTFPFFLSLMRP